MQQKTCNVILELMMNFVDQTQRHKTVPGISGFHPRMSDPIEKSTAIYHMTYHELSCQTIVHYIMTKMAKSIEQKSMSFAVIVGDHPVYKLILELKCENP